MQAMQRRRECIDVRLKLVMLNQALAVAHPALRALYAKHPGCAVRLLVSDDRPDIDPAMLGKNFEPNLTTEEASEGPRAVPADGARHRSAARRRDCR